VSALSVHARQSCERSEKRGRSSLAIPFYGAPIFCFFIVMPEQFEYHLYTNLYQLM
jgi:hypothetical protein